jgi:hypothetical protein
MIRLLFLLTIWLLLFQTSFSQGITYNMTSFAARQFAARGSGCWGYSDTMIVNGQLRPRELAFMGLVSGVSIVDITTSQARQIGFVPTQGTDGGNDWREIRTSGHYAYITTEATGGGLQIVNLRPDNNNPDSIRLVRKYDLPADNRSHNLGSNAGYAWEAGNYIYICGGSVTTGGANTGGVLILDVTNKENPVVAGTYAPRYVHDVYVKNDTAYLAMWGCHKWCVKGDIEQTQNKQSNTSDYEADCRRFNHRVTQRLPEAGRPSGRERALQTGASAYRSKAAWKCS